MRESLRRHCSITSVRKTKNIEFCWTITNISCYCQSSRFFDIRFTVRFGNWNKQQFRLKPHLSNWKLSNTQCFSKPVALKNETIGGIATCTIWYQYYFAVFQFAIFKIGRRKKTDFLALWMTFRSFRTPLLETMQKITIISAHQLMLHNTCLAKFFLRFTWISLTKIADYLSVQLLAFLNLEFQPQKIFHRVSISPYHHTWATWAIISIPYQKQNNVHIV